jgi:hypothetical protein
LQREPVEGRQAWHFFLQLPHADMPGHINMQSSTTRLLSRHCHLFPRHPVRIFRHAYFSEHHPDPAPFPPTQDKILSSALSHVPHLGFSSEALSLGAKDAGYLDVSVQLFPRGVYDLINYHLVTQRLALKNRVQFPEDGRLGVGKKVKILTMQRLQANKDIIHQWQEVRRNSKVSSSY